MTNRRHLFISALLFSLGLFSFATYSSADSALSVTVTPPLFQLTIGPGESWTSALKIVNNNTYDVTYYAQVVDMQANGENGQSKFVPIIGPPDPALAASELARWMTISAAPITVKAGKTMDLPFTVKIPFNAEPGGHYAAILVGTQPLAGSSTGTQLKVSSYVSSLLFARVKGDVIETGRIREFVSDQGLYQTPNANFTLRFENTGNTHLKPEGNVTIYNMWGKERGKVLINQDSNFGNVLPKSIRRFQFSWEGEQSVFDIGRYSATVTLTFGQDEKKNISATTYFWVVPIVPVAMTLGTLVLFLLVLAWFIRRYIRRALELERERYGVALSVPMPEAPKPMLETMIEPLRVGVVDLRKVTAQPQTTTQSPMANEAITMQEGISLGEFLRKYKLFFAFVIILLVCVAGLWIYLEKVLVPERNFNINSVVSQEENAASSTK